MTDFKKHDITAITTVVGQLIAGFFAIAIPGTITLIITILINQEATRVNMRIPFPFGAAYVFFVSGGLAFLILNSQFYDSLSNEEVKKLSIKWAFKIGVILNIFNLCLIGSNTFLIFLIRLTINQIAPLLSAYILYYLVKVWHKWISYDVDTHKFLTNSDTSLQSCRNGELPYTYLVSTFWSNLGTGLFSILLIILSIVSFTQVRDPAGSCFSGMFFGLVAFFILFVSIKGFIDLKSADVKNHVGQFIASMHVSRGYRGSITSYSLASGSHKFSTHEGLYHFVKNLEGETLRVWYTPHGAYKYAFLAERYAPHENSNDSLQQLKN